MIGSLLQKRGKKPSQPKQAQSLKEPGDFRGAGRPPAAPERPQPEPCGRDAVGTGRVLPPDRYPRRAPARPAGKMPRSFLVKKHFNASKKPNYSELDTHTVIISPYLYESYPMPVIPQPEILSSGAYSPITMWTTAAPFHSPLPNGHSPLSGYPSSLGRVSPPPPSDTSSKDHSGSESPISDEEERLQSKLSDPHAIEAEKFQCNLCNKTYSTFSGLAKHKQLHCDAQSRKSFSCKYCDKEYVSLGALKMHIRTHTLPCVCKICGKAFSRPWLLQGHIRTHTGEKPFSCPHCNRAFADRSNLRAHLQTHSDVKKYQCKNCSKTFSRMSLLHKHEESGCCVAH
ncbi:zinc finger protein SNAI2 [Diceros bicornis minor]|nr:zinc finger protein SNAI2 [Diceros bicornis minor]XP_058420418.1 zinc finger protein SNAI2 [Diceros bicornis minor]